MRKNASVNGMKQIVRDNKFYQKYIKKHWSRFKGANRCLKNIILYGRIDFRKFHIIEDKKTIYLANAKVANSSIKASLRDITISQDKEYVLIHRNSAKNEVHTLKNKSVNYESFYKFTYVRNPFARLVSCYKNKVQDDKNEKWFQRRMFKYLHDLSKDEGFDVFVKKICKISVPWMDEHFSTQYNLIHGRDGKCLVDYVGKFEDLPDDYNKRIADVYGFKHLPHYNKTDKSKKWEDYYTVETAKLVYKKYKKDFEAFGYESSYEELINYLNDKQKSKKVIAPSPPPPLTIFSCFNTSIMEKCS